MSVKIHSHIWVCPCCMLAHANGECCELHAAQEDAPGPWLLWEGEPLDIAMGGEHVEGCPNGPDGPRDADCDCETREFSTSQCQGCGSYVHGDRYAFTVFYRDGGK